MNIFLDDERNPINVTWVELPLVPWVIVRNYDEFCRTIRFDGLPDLISFDHDLGDEAYQEAFKNNLKTFDYTKVREKTGYDCALWLVNYCLDRRVNLPQYYIHTMNPIGAENITKLFESYQRSALTK
jgi:hypothetical protein